MRILLLAGLIGLLSFSCTKSDTDIVLQSISFEDNAVTLSAGATMQLTPVYEPAAFDGIPVVWTSSDPTTVTVTSGGFLYAINHGSSWITVKDKNGSTTGKCLVTVQ